MYTQDGCECEHSEGHAVGSRAVGDPCCWTPEAPNRKRRAVQLPLLHLKYRINYYNNFITAMSASEEEEGLDVVALLSKPLLLQSPLQVQFVSCV